jgi:Lrp/AsnC family transcriptional regulator, leucine-responsive regulatory protein
MSPKNEQETQKIRTPDDLDRAILNELTKNSRIKLTDLAKKVRLSIDSTKKRMLRLQKDGVLTKYTIQVDMAQLGLPMGVHIYLKLKDLTEQHYNELIAHLKKDPRVIDLIAMIGDYDLYVVLLAKNAAELKQRKMKIRQRFSSIIADWNEVVVAEIYKLEEYVF